MFICLALLLSLLSPVSAIDQDATQYEGRSTVNLADGPESRHTVGPERARDSPEAIRQRKDLVAACHAVSWGAFSPGGSGQSCLGYRKGVDALSSL